jgi:hypothetical protein
MMSAVSRLGEMQFVRISAGLNLREADWHGYGGRTTMDDRCSDHAVQPACSNAEGKQSFARWNCQTGQNNVTYTADAMREVEVPQWWAQLCRLHKVHHC